MYGRGDVDLRESPEEKKKKWDGIARSVDKSKLTFLSNANTSNEEKAVAKNGNVAFSDMASQLSYDLALSANLGNQNGSESTVVMESAFMPPQKNNSYRMEIEDDNTVTPSPQKPQTLDHREDTHMEDAGKNDMADGVGGSHPHSVAVEPEKWVWHRLKKEESELEASLFQWSMR